MSNTPTFAEDLVKLMDLWNWLDAKVASEFPDMNPEERYAIMSQVMDNKLGLSK